MSSVLSDDMSKWYPPALQCDKHDTYILLIFTDTWKYNFRTAGLQKIVSAVYSYDISSHTDNEQGTTK